MYDLDILIKKVTSDKTTGKSNELFCPSCGETAGSLSPICKRVNCSRAF